MHDISHIWETFEQLGGVFVNSPAQIQEKASKIAALCFDWDGVFNDGQKSLGQGSLFSEADSMGINLLRFGFWLKTGKIPPTYIITGENNREAFQLAAREGFNGVFFGVSDKIKALEHIIKLHGFSAMEVAYFFDDVLDLSVCEQVGIRLMVRRSASPLFTNYVINNSLADYISAHEGNNFAVRELCELLLGLLENYESVVENRLKFSAAYQNYLAERNNQEPKFFRFIDTSFKVVESEI
jgi:3-deoxy-D-manno-octulosonate 8-phosphate phosphatase (KDO 8-P phosphatase)